MSFASAWLRNCDLRCLAADVAVLRGDGEALRNVAWARSPGWLGLGAALCDGIRLWDHASRAQRQVGGCVSGGVARTRWLGHLALRTVGDGDAFRDCDQCL